MCGIAGIIDDTANADLLRERVQRMQRALLHRGPDDQGLFVAPKARAAFAQTRLSIIDLSEAGHQPMPSACGRYTIVFNGEIYNYQALRAELLSEGTVFRTETDTEVVLQLFIRDRGKCLDRLRGMFAFAIWDDVAGECFLARDPLGIKPLYYTESKGAFVFASEIRALLKAGYATSEIDPVAVYGYLRTGSVPEPLTPVRNVRQLGSGHCALWKNGKLELDQYWSLPQHFGTQACGSMEEAVERTRTSLLESIERHFVSDVPVGIFLSGGIDSTAVLALSRIVTDNQLSTFSISVDDPALNEGDDARRISEHFKSHHSELHLDANRASEWIDAFLSSMDMPSIDGFNTYCVSRFASENGAKVVLSGLGGDELFGGYGSFNTIPKMLRASRSLGPFRKPAALALGATAGALGQNRFQRAADFLNGPPTVSRAFSAMRGVFTHREALGILAGRGQKVDAESAAQVVDGNPCNGELPDSIADQISTCELNRYMRNQLLRDSDVMSMTHGLELRVPLVDRALFENVAAIPSEFRIQPSKRLFTRAVPEIPQWILDRPKRGFTFPFGSWLQDRWSYLGDALPETPGLDLSKWYRQWALITLQQWERNLGSNDLS